MSQIFKGLTSGNLPPSVLLQVTADDSTTAAPDTNNLNIFSNETDEDNPNGIQTTADMDTLTIQLTNRLSGSGSSTNATPVTLLTFPLHSNMSDISVYRFQFQIAGISTAGANVGEGVGYTIDASARSDSTNATIIGTPFQDADEDTSLSAASIAISTVDNNILVVATGIPDSAGPTTETIQYILSGSYVQLVV